MRTNGQHVTADIWLNEYDIEINVLMEICKSAINGSNALILGDVFHNFGGQACTGLWLLSESHFSVHTFPERNYLSIDCYTCGGIIAPTSIIADVMKSLNINRADVKVISRGGNE